MMSSSDPLRARLRRKLGLERYEAVLGDEAGVIFEPGRAGYVRVRYVTASGESQPQTVRMPRLPTAMAPGTPVWVGFDEEEQLAVIGPRLSGQLAAGINPFLNHTGAADPSGGFIDLSQATLLRSAPTTPPSLSVIVKALLWQNGTTVTLFPGDIVDLTSAVPTAAGQHRLAGLFLNLTTNSITVTQSTAQSTLDPLDLTDVQECAAAAPSSSIPIWCWRLEYGMTTITDEHSFLDFRQWLNLPSSGGGGGADDTPVYLSIWW